MHRPALGHGQPGLEHGLAEQVAVLGDADGVNGRADQPHAVAFQHAVFAQRQGQVQPGLPAHGGQHRIRPFLGDDGFQRLGRQRLDVGGVGQLGVGHHGGRVGVDQDDAVALRAQRLDRLRAGIIELGRLPDDDRPGAGDEDGVDIGAFWHEDL